MRTFTFKRHKIEELQLVISVVRVANISHIVFLCWANPLNTIGKFARAQYVCYLFGRARSATKSGNKFLEPGLFGLRSGHLSSLKNHG